MNVIEEVLLGEDNVSTLPWQALDDRFSSFQLYGKLVNIFADLPNSSLKDTGMFKAITGGDKIMGERKHKDGFKFKPFCALVFSCNLIPKNYRDRSDAFFDRLIIIRFDNVVSQDQMDRDLPEKLAAEADGIFKWALEGLHRLMENGWEFSTTTRTVSELQQYKTEGSYVLQFANDCCIADPDSETLRTEIWSAFDEYCSENGIDRSKISKQAFNKELENHFKLTRSREALSRHHTFVGIRLNK